MSHPCRAREVDACIGFAKRMGFAASEFSAESLSLGVAAMWEAALDPMDEGDEKLAARIAARNRDKEYYR
jgi:hypothetical protein